MEERINSFLQISYSTGEGYGSGVGYGTGEGYGSGNGTGESYSSGYGFGAGYGFDNGNGTGYDTGAGYGIGIGYGTDTGEGYGHGSSEGILYFNKDRVYVIDNINTIIESVRGSVAKGFILNNDLTVTPCYVAKSGNYFAHGETLKEAVAGVVKKHRDNMPVK